MKIPTAVQYIVLSLLPSKSQCLLRLKRNQFQVHLKSSGTDAMNILGAFVHYICVRLVFNSEENVPISYGFDLRLLSITLSSQHLKGF